MSLKKTQLELVSRLVNRYNTGNIKQGWSLTTPSHGAPFLSLQKLNEGNSAHKLAELFPNVFSAEQKAWRLVILRLENDSEARKLLAKCNQ